MEAPVRRPVKESWDVLRRAPACSGCARPFAPGDEACARLEADGGALARTDFCPACWAARDEDPEALFWRSRVPEPGARRDPFDAAELFGMFQRLEEEGRSDRARLRYLLALYCSRKRLLRLRGIAREAGGEVLRFTAPRSRREYRVPAVELTAADMDAAREELARLAAPGA